VFAEIFQPQKWPFARPINKKTGQVNYIQVIWEFIYLAKAGVSFYGVKFQAFMNPSNEPETSNY